MAALRNFLLRRSPSYRGTNLSTRGLFLLLWLLHAPRIIAASISCLGGEWWRGRGDVTTRYVSKKNFKWNPPCIFVEESSKKIESKSSSRKCRRIIFIFFFFSFLKLNEREFYYCSSFVYGFLYGRKEKNIKGIIFPQIIR